MKAVRILVLFCLVLPLALPGALLAQTQDPPLDMRILVDVSSDMADNDPGNLRLPAAHLLFELIPEGSRSGLWTFGRYVNMLVPYGTVNQGWRQVARSRALEIGNPGFNSNIGGAFETASFDLEWSTGYRPKTYILLSDGRVDIEPDAAASRAERARILQEIVPRLREHNSTIHTIALSDSMDHTFMEQLASQTGGISAVAQRPEDLLGLFMQILNISLGAQEEVGIAEDQTFLIDSTISEMTAAIFHRGDSPLRLISPSGETYDAQNPPPHSQWVEAEHYDVITIRTPSAGEWRIEGDLTPQSRVTVVSELSLQVDSVPLNVSPGEEVPLRAILNDAEGQVTDSDFLDLLTMNAQLRKNNEVVAETPLLRNSPEFSGVLTMPAEAGTYQLAVTVDGQSFERRRVFTLNVRQPVSAEVSAEQNEYEIRLYPNVPDLPQEVARIIAEVTGPGGESRLQTFTRDEAGHWSLIVEPFAGEGQYEADIDIQFTGSTRWTGGVNVAPVNLTFPGEAGMPVSVATTAPVPEPEPVPELAPVPALDDLTEPTEPEVALEPEPEPAPEPAPAPEPEPEPEPVAPTQEPATVPDLDEPAGPASDPFDWLPYAIAAGSGLAFVLIFYALYRRFGGGRTGDDPRLHDQLSKAEQAMLAETDGKGSADEQLEKELQKKEKTAAAKAEDIPTVSEPAGEEDDISVLDEDFDLQSLGITSDDSLDDAAKEKDSEADWAEMEQAYDEADEGEKKPPPAPEGSSEPDQVDPLDQDDPFADDEFDLSDDEIDDMLDDTLVDEDDSDQKGKGDKDKN
ncbi:MAG: VWA domain-containing protein [Natronospirillum sp.]|uniref:vWA domain-containing protein n=1 Tax=Natronospirillum sp. TaxID=2812955 RepID=UPI0025D08466|nr:vWA domain-containing protein [Natronospirillum sp.]MCH8550616.1 VWA domain-containing protein [Natronospirillum sp.]